MARVEIVLRVPKERLKGTVLVTGFPGFGKIGYVVPRYLASAMKLVKAGYVLTSRMPSIVIMEDDGVGFPFEIYYGNGITVVVNRAVPDPRDQVAYCDELARLASEAGVNYAILVGGLSREYEPSDEKFGYRWLHNTHYNGPRLKAPLMEEGLGVVGPLALLHIYMEHYGVPSVMVLPYSNVTGVDYDSALVGAKVILEELLGTSAPLAELEQLAAKQREELEKVVEILSQEEREKERRGGTIFM
ncbi:MAG: proteasome assembly chaperone family protein [Acidilobus sp.]